METFSDTYCEIVQKHFATDKFDRKVLLDRIEVNIEVVDLSGFEEEEAMQLMNFKKDMLGGSRMFLT